MDPIQIFLIQATVLGGALIILLIYAISSKHLRAGKDGPSSSSLSFRATMGTLALAGIFLSGCGQTGSRLAVNGEVSLDGVPIKAGSILMVPTFKERGPKAGAKIVDGKYKFTSANGPIEGVYRVEIYAEEKDPFPMDDPIAFTEQAAKDPSKLAPANAIPVKFNKRSTLNANPSKDRKQFDFHLKS